MNIKPITPYAERSCSFNPETIRRLQEAHKKATENQRNQIELDVDNYVTACHLSQLPEPNRAKHWTQIALRRHENIQRKYKIFI